MIASSGILLLKFHSAPVHWNMLCLIKVASYLILTVTRMPTLAASIIGEQCIVFVLEFQGEKDRQTVNYLSIICSLYVYTLNTF